MNLESLRCSVTAPMRCTLDPAGFHQPRESDWCIPVSMSLLAHSHGLAISHEQIIRAFLKLRGAQCAVNSVMRDHELEAMIGERFGPGLVEGLNELVGSSHAVRASAGDDHPVIVDRIKSAIVSGGALLTSTCTAPGFHIVPWIGFKGDDLFCAWEPVNRLYVVATRSELEDVLAPDRWHCWLEPKPSEGNTNASQEDVLA